MLAPFIALNMLATYRPSPTCNHAPDYKVHREGGKNHIGCGEKNLGCGEKVHLSVVANGDTVPPPVAFKAVVVGNKANTSAP